MSVRIPDDAQGELQGLIASAAGLSMIVSPFVMTQSFSFFSEGGAPIYFPGAPFAIAALLIIVSMIIVAPFVRISGGPPAREQQGAAE